MRKLQALGQTGRWVGTCGSHLWTSAPCCLRLGNRLPLMEWNRQPSCGQAVGTTGTVLHFHPGTVSTAPLSAFFLGYEREAEGTVIQEREMTETFLL